LAVGALSLFVVFTGCRALDAPMISELPSPAPNAPQCAGSTLAMAPSDAKGGTPVVPKNNSAPTGSFGVVFQTRSKADPTARSVDIVRPDGSGLKEIVSGFFDAEKPVVAPNRRLVAYEIDRGGLSRPELHVLDVSGLNDHKLYKADRYVTGVTWSPDSKYLAFLSDDHLKIVAAHGGPIKIITDHRHWLPDVSSDHAAWSPRGDWIAFTDSATVIATLVVIHPDGTGRKNLAEVGYTAIAWAPDGSQIAFLHRGVSTVRPDGQGIRHLVATPEGASIGSVSWSPDGQYIIYEGGPALPDDVTVCAVEVDHPGLYHLGDCAYWQDSVAWSPDSRRVVFPQMKEPGCPRNGQWHLQFVDVRTQQRSQIAEPSPVEGELNWAAMPCHGSCFLR
jgi:Tol biopolymer transport system component